MDIGKIISGHTKEVFKVNEELKEERIKICKKCPLYNESRIGPICSPYLYVNPQTGDISHKFRSGYIKGCGCRLNAKARLKDAQCPLSKWGK